ncbi:sensor histidine kinase [Neoroseomonas oryzicola]|uniref:histidine kinase n=1 Tax=Neoroseomonas oryzicola TaxID=535904 RepID=A0A9X9WKU9_9PROT|nr:sensor histidine kinase [Neoroseomonas oryzicola]MBR0660959.1 hypothetical protein [Neoroseomonas oryzicola]NKE19839.1 hypothetical protein [Neoroseomonas oryzicola]
MPTADNPSRPMTAVPPRLAAGHARRAVLTAALMGFSLIAIWTVAVLLVNQATRSASEKAIAQAEVAARVLEQFVLRTVEGVESSLALLRARRLLEASGDTAAAEQVGQRLAEVTVFGRFGLRRISDVAPDGATRWSLPPGADGAAMSSGVVPHLAEPLPGPGLFVGTPRRDPATGHWSVLISRPIEDESGAIIGTAEVVIDPLAFSADLAQMSPGVLDLMFVMRRDGTYLARSDAAERALGEEAAAGRRLLIAAEGSGGGSFRDMSPIDGRDRFFALRPVPGTPLVVAAGVDATTALAPVRDVLVLSPVTALLTSALVVLMALFGRRRHERLHTLAQLQQARLAEAAAAAARAEIEALLAGLPIAVYRARITHVRGLEVTYASAAMAELAEANAAIAGTGFLATLLEGRDATVEYEVVRPGRPSIWLREGARVVATRPDGVEVVGYRADITTERQFATQAAEASKLATLGEMATGLAHELNQPVTAMALGADNAADALEAEGASGIAEAVETLRRVAGQASRAQAIIDHLRVFGRRDPGPLGPVEVERAVDGALVLAANALRSAGIVVERHIPPDLPAVQAQIVLLEQVLLNLFLNARDALVLRPQGTRRIVVSARTEHSGRVLLLVRDTGGGVPAEVIDRVFEPFYTTKPVGQGTGLGLALCHGMMAALGGSIRVSNVDGGAEFVLDLAPVAAVSAPAEEAGHLV